MGYLIVGLVVCLSAMIVSVVVASRIEDEVWPWMISIFIAIPTAILACVVSIYGFGFKQAEIKSRIIRREYNIEYTAEEIFYAEDVIDTIRELDRKRIEVNGDLLDGDNQ